MIKWILSGLGADSTKVGARVIRPSRPISPPTLPANKRLLYRLTDPEATPALCKEEEASPQEAPFFQVLGFVGGGHGLETAQGQAASLYMNIDKALRNYKTFAERPLNRWAAVSVLFVVPRAGRQINAYYDRRSLTFFFERDKTLNKDVFTADSPDVTIHELGHAVLDYLRPDFWSAASVEIASLHEAWADTFSFVSQLQHVEVVEAVLQLTGGDLRKTNIVASMAEELGRTIYNDFNPPGANPSWMRNAINDYKYVNPATLPSDGPEDQLCNECHSFSRIMTGTLYDIMVTIYETEKGTGTNPVVALLNAAKGVGFYMDRAMSRTPVTTEALPAFAQTMLQVDRDICSSYYQDKFRKVFQNRQLIPESVSMLRMRNPGLTRIVLNKAMPSGVSALSDNPLYNVELQIPDEGMVSVLAAKQFVDYLHTHGLVSPDPWTPFEVLDGKLVRTHFQSDCYRPNWTNPTQPEFYKPPKPQNNFCPCGCRTKAEMENEVAARRVVRQSLTRYKITK